MDAPVALFFGAGTLYNREGREYLVKAFPTFIRFGQQQIELACFFPMPFFKSARRYPRPLPAPSARQSIDGIGHFLKRNRGVHATFCGQEDLETFRLSCVAFQGSSQVGKSSGDPTRS